MTIHDITVQTTSSTITWDGEEPGLSVNWVALVGPESPINLSTVSLGSHTGTHLDSPHHFSSDGIRVAELDLNTLIGPATLVEIPGRPTLRASDLESAAIPASATRLLFKTDNTHRHLLADTRFHRDYAALAPDAARWLVAHGARLVGVDYLSVGPYGDEGLETHRILLDAGVIIIENLDLSAVAPGEYTLIALPPRWDEVEGAPCRAVLISE